MLINSEAVTTVDTTLTFTPANKSTSMPDRMPIFESMRVSINDVISMFVPKRTSASTSIAYDKYTRSSKVMSETVTMILSSTTANKPALINPSTSKLMTAPTHTPERTSHTGPGYEQLFTTQVTLLIFILSSFN